MARTVPLTPDRITGVVAPLGELTGFPKSYVRSAWPTPIGKKLTNRRIAMYAKQGKYVTNVQTRREKQVIERARKTTKLDELI